MEKNSIDCECAIFSSAELNRDEKPVMITKNCVTIDYDFTCKNICIEFADSLKYIGFDLFCENITEIYGYYVSQTYKYV